MEQAACGHVSGAFSRWLMDVGRSSSPQAMHLKSGRSKLYKEAGCHESMLESIDLLSLLLQFLLEFLS